VSSCIIALPPPDPAPVDTTDHVAQGILCGVLLRHRATTASISDPGLLFRFSHAATFRRSVELRSCWYEGRRDLQMLLREGTIKLTWLSPIRSSWLWLEYAFESGSQRNSAAAELPSGALCERRCRVRVGISCCIESRIWRGESHRYYHSSRWLF
jgi:hypothetical protein